MRGSVIAAAAVASSLLCSPPAEACRKPCDPLTLEVAYEESEAVFYGRVVSRTDLSLVDDLTFEVLRTFKGEAAKRRVVRVSSGTCDPMGDMAKPGDKFLVFMLPAHGTKGAEAGLCGGSVKVVRDAQEKALFSKLSSFR